MTAAVADELGPHTLAEWHAADQPVDGSRLELLAGSWLVTPAPGMPHQWCGDELRELVKYRLRDADRSDLIVVTAVAVDISSSGRTGLIPDIVLCDRTAGPIVPADQVQLAVEIWSEGNTRAERADKRAAYAAAGVPWFWELTTDDGGPVELVAHRLVAGHYRTADRVPRGTAAIVTAAPVPVTVDLDALRT